MFVLIYPLCFNSNYPRAFLESVLHLNASGIYFLSGFNQIGSNISVNYSLPKFFYGWKAQIFSLSFHTMAFDNITSDDTLSQPLFYDNIVNSGSIVHAMLDFNLNLSTCS